MTSEYEFVLKTPTAPGCKSGEPTLTYLDRGQFYRLRLKKFRTKPNETQLVVCVRLGFVEHEFQQIELELLNQWCSLHPGERMFEMEYGSTRVCNNMFISQHDPRSNQYTNRASLIWNPEEEVKVSIKFNCVSSQFISKLYGLEQRGGAQLRLIVEVFSELTGTKIDSVACLVKVCWFGGAKRAIQKDLYRVCEAEQIGFQYEPSLRQTLLTPFKNEKTYLQVSDEKDFSSLAPFQLALPISRWPTMSNFSHDYRMMIYSLDLATNSITRNDASTPTAYLDAGELINFRIRNLCSIANGELVRTNLRLEFNDPELAQHQLEEFANWSLVYPGENILEIGFDHTKTKECEPIPESLFDINRNSSASVNFVWAPTYQQQEIFIPLTIKCLAEEFPGKLQTTPPETSPLKFLKFLVVADSYLIKSGRQIDSASCYIQVYDEGGSEKQRELDKDELQANATSDHYYKPSYQNVIFATDQKYTIKSVFYVTFDEIEHYTIYLKSLTFQELKLALSNLLKSMKKEAAETDKIRDIFILDESIQEDKISLLNNANWIQTNLKCKSIFKFTLVYETAVKVLETDEESGEETSNVQSSNRDKIFDVNLTLLYQGQ